MLLRLYRLLYKVTGDRCWLLKCVDIIQQKAWEDIRKFREEVENETN